MSLLTIYSKGRLDDFEAVRDHAAIARRLAALGVRFERWTVEPALEADAPEAILEAYEKPIRELKRLYGFQSSDVVSIQPDHPQKNELRTKFLSEHTHSDFEIRFFVDGCGLFFLHPDEDFYGLLCEQGDLISVPAGVKHWFDMGELPNFKCIRLFTRPDGWVAEFTGNELARSFPTLEEFSRSFFS